MKDHYLSARALPAMRACMLIASYPLTGPLARA